MKRALTLAMLCSGLAACGSEDHQDLRAWMEQSTQGLKGQVKPLPEIKPSIIVAYETGSLIDPFSAAKIEPERKKGGGGGGVGPDLDRRKEPLEQYPLDSLAMVGVLQQGKVAYALIKADTTLHRVRSGNYMGQNFGVITAIADDGITLKEIVQDADGEWVERTSTLQLLEQETNK
ncbi:MAG: pilus assembly protein PilP [Methyloversatilis sp.]|uniref:pilus assembly protein PilP n=1 Tax=Methyloversatilis sp. TaxID=2569862 RepID=UPI001A419C1E|nr:pilus assembly protein PilP [Methyloversatilis sp.]MBL8475044.1 pilus assembly protein PilP [Methyloversatilis sp.]